MQFIGTETSQGTAWTSPTQLSNTADSLQGSIYSNQAGTFTVKQSGNGTDWDVTDTISVSASTGTKINVALLNPFVCVAWASGSSPTTFRLFARMTSAGVKA